MALLLLPYGRRCPICGWTSIAATLEIRHPAQRTVFVLLRPFFVNILWKLLVIMLYVYDLPTYWPCLHRLAPRGWLLCLYQSASLTAMCCSLIVTRTRMNLPICFLFLFILQSTHKLLFNVINISIYLFIYLFVRPLISLFTFWLLLFFKPVAKSQICSQLFVSDGGIHPTGILEFWL